MSIEDIYLSMLEGKYVKKDGEDKHDKQDDGEGMDAVGHGDKDIDNDGDSDESDAYLSKRRKAISKSMKEAAGQAVQAAIAKRKEDDQDTLHRKGTEAQAALHAAHTSKMIEKDAESEHDKNAKSVADSVKSKAGKRRGDNEQGDKMDKMTQTEAMDPRRAKSDEVIKQAVAKYSKGAEEIRKRRAARTLQQDEASCNRMKREETELEESVMSDLHQMIKEKKPAAEIAKELKIDVATVKRLMKENYAAKAMAGKSPLKKKYQPKDDKEDHAKRMKKKMYGNMMGGLKEEEQIEEVKVPNNYAAMMAKKKRKAVKLKGFGSDSSKSNMSDPAARAALMKKEGAKPPFAKPYSTDKGPKKDKYGNEVKNVAKFLAKKGMKKAQGMKEEGVEESTAAYGATMQKQADDKKKAAMSGGDKDKLKRLSDMMKNANK